VKGGLPGVARKRSRVTFLCFFLLSGRQKKEDAHMIIPMTAHILILTSLLLSSCSAAPLPSSQSSSSRSSISATLEQVPAQFSVDYFGKMKFEGKDLKLTQVEKNSAYTKYNATYRSNGLLITGVMLIPNTEGSSPLVMMNHGYISTKVYTQGRGLGVQFVGAHQLRHHQAQAHAALGLRAEDVFGNRCLVGVLDATLPEFGAGAFEQAFQRAINASALLAISTFLR
jgi:hypothetical protein